MIKVTIQFDTYKKINDEAQLVRLLIQGRGAPAKLKTRISVPQTIWNPKSKEVTGRFRGKGKEEMNSIIRREQVRLEKFIEKIEDEEPGLTCQQIKKKYENQQKVLIEGGIDVIEYFKKMIVRMDKLKRYGNSRSYWESLMKIIEHVNYHKYMEVREAFRGLGKSRRYSDGLKFVDTKLMLHRINKNFLQDFDDNMSCRGAASRSKHLRALRSILNDVIEDHELNIKNPFKGFKMPKASKKSRSTDIEAVRKLAHAEITHKETRYYRDWFIFSFAMAGMGFKDVYYVDKKVSGKYVVYHREKLPDDREGPLLKTIIPPIAKEFLKTKRPPGNYRDRLYTASRCNKLLRKLAVKLEIEDKITSHVARHTWNMVAKSIGYPEELRKEILGHADGSSHDHYDGGFDQDTKDECVLKVASLLK